MANKGPDQVIPTDDFKTSEPDGVIQIPDSGDGEESISVYSFFKNIATKYPEQLALVLKRDEELKKWTYQEYFDDACCAAKAMIKLGLERFHGVCIMGYNSPEWFIANHGIVFAGGFSAGVYTTNSAESCYILAENCKAQIVLVDTEKSLRKFLDVKHKLPDLKVIVQWIGEPTQPGVLSWADFMAIGRAESDAALKERLSLAALNQCCTLIYTSGTTGPPKGVMLSQDQMTWCARKYKMLMDLQDAEECVVSYLPLSHLAAHMVDIYIAIVCAATAYFASPDALKGKLGEALREARPTFFCGVPRVWEKIYEKMQDAAGNAGFIKRTMGSWAKSYGFSKYEALMEGRELGTLANAKVSLAKSLILDRIKAILGLDRARTLVSGGAPIAPEILQYFFSLDLPIQELYGLSESLSFCSLNEIKPSSFKLGSVGKAQTFIEVAIKPCDEQLGEKDGEICMRGRNVCMGYLRMPQKTNDAIDDDRWLHTGDIGWFDLDGFLHITGRIKELVITSGGENIPPVLIEEAIKKELPCVSQAFLVGDKRKYLNILLTFKSEVDVESGAPLPELTSSCKEWMENNGSSLNSVTEVIQNIKNEPKGILAKAIQDGIDRYNLKHSISNAQKVQRWAILPNDFSLPTGEFNNTLKMKRPFIVKKYAKLIDKTYSDDWGK